MHRLTVNAKGEFTDISGAWTFIPAYFGEDENAGNEKDQVTTREDVCLIPDTDYLHFGWWTCSVTVDAKGEFTAVTGVWTFIPAYFGEDEKSIAEDDSRAESY